MRTPTVSAPAPVLTGTYGDYEEVQRAVDLLSDEGFPVDHASIVWADLRRVERVTGRRTVGRAFLEGAATGAWFGLVLAILLSLFVELDGISWLAFLLWYAAAGAVAVGAFSALGHWLRRGQRDFSSVGYLDATRYELWIEADMVDRARAVLHGGGAAGVVPSPEPGTVPPPADGPPGGSTVDGRGTASA